MFISDCAIFLGKEEEGFQTEFILEKIFYFVFEIKNSFSKEEIQKMIGRIKEQIRTKEPKNLLDFKTIINQEIEKKIKDQPFSLASGLLINDVFYLLTLGEGEIYLKREKKTETIISGDNSASGYLKNNDFFIFASKNFSLLVDKQRLNDQLADYNPKEAVEKLTPELKEKEDVGAIAVFLKFYQQEEKENFEEMAEEELLESPGRSWFFHEKWEDFKNKMAEFSLNLKRRFVYYHQKTPQGKKTTFVVVLFLFFLLLWSVVFGYQRRAHSQLMNKVKSYEEKISGKLNEASDLSTINLNRSLVLLAEAKKEFGDLKKIVGKKEIKEVENLGNLVSTKEKEIVKKEEKKSTEFYDLALITKEAQGKKMYLDKENIAILNPDLGEIYNLSLTKKSNRMIKKGEIKKAGLVSLYNNDTFFFNKEKGIYKIDQDDKINLAVKKDKGWGEIVDFWIYNGNLYLLDKNKDEIYKYLVAEEGYSGKTSYFKSDQSIDLAEANSIAIDSSVYIATNNNIYKYTAGVREEFNLDLPEKENLSFTKVFTDKNSNKIYLWEKAKGRIYVISKNGQYERQINSSIFSQASDFVVLESEGIFVLVKEKIYKVGLE
jgi:hypothetical protein